MHSAHTHTHFHMHTNKYSIYIHAPKTRDTFYIRRFKFETCPTYNIQWNGMLCFYSCFCFVPLRSAADICIMLITPNEYSSDRHTQTGHTQPTRKHLLSVCELFLITSESLSSNSKWISILSPRSHSTITIAFAFESEFASTFMHAFNNWNIIYSI